MASRKRLLVNLAGLCIGLSACTAYVPGTNEVAPSHRIATDRNNDNMRDVVTRFSMGGEDENKVGPNSPLDLVIDNRSQVWIHSEFSNSILKINRHTGEKQWIALPDDGPIFGFGERGRTTITSLAEDIVFDGKSHVWLTQGGAFGLYRGDGNHSRIVSVNINTNEATSYPVPGDHNSVIGIDYDRQNNKIYFVEGSFAGNQPRLVSFRPGAIDTAIRFDDPEGLEALRCYDPSESNCYFTESVPFATPARMAIAPDGFVYITAAFGTHIVRYDPVTRQFVKLLSPPPRIGWLPELDVSMPWDIDVEPTLNQVFWTEYPDEQILRFDANRAANGECHLELESPDGTRSVIGNAAMDDCITEYDATPPGEEGNRLKTHSLDVDQTGNVWFTTGNYVGVLARGDSLPRFYKIEGNIAEGENENVPDHMTGIKVLDDSNEVWINSFGSREVYRVEKDVLFQMMTR